MFKRIYIHNFRCFENFELVLGDRHSALLIGNNGVGKSTIRAALLLLQSIARGTNRVGQLIKPTDFFLFRPDVPMRFEVDVELGGRQHQYRLVFDFPAKFRELRVKTETFIVDGQTIYSRDSSKVSHIREGRPEPAEFMIDWHLVGLPVIQEQSETDPVFVFKRWLAQALILAPIPSLMTGDSPEETLELEQDARNIGSWYAGIINGSSKAISVFQKYLEEGAIKDFEELNNPIIASSVRSLVVHFARDGQSVKIPFAMLSDGEKCFFLCAFVLAANKAYGPVFCFWDEPENNLAIHEVELFVMALRRTFEQHGGQILMTSHNAQTIQAFSGENTFYLYRRDHLEPTRMKLLEEIETGGDKIGALLRGDIDP